LIAWQPSEAMGAGPARVCVAALEPSTSDAKQPTQEGALLRFCRNPKMENQEGIPFRVESNRSSRRKVEIEDFQMSQTQFNEIGSQQQGFLRQRQNPRNAEKRSSTRQVRLPLTTDLNPYRTTIEGIESIDPTDTVNECWGRGTLNQRFVSDGLLMMPSPDPIHFGQYQIRAAKERQHFFYQ
jgi:hypothetical protein